MNGQYEAVIGLEVHAQLLSRSKMFCACSAEFGAPANTHVCPVCLGLPGALPVPNREAIRMAIRAALALGCAVRPRSRFARKNYFYPDLPKGYQISQYELPLNEHGRLLVETEAGTREVGITRIHLEEDAAKNIHGVGIGSETAVDFNRAGTPLMEIVSEPDMRSAAEAEEYLKRLREILMFIGVNDGNLEEGSFRCDANVSIRPVGTEQLQTRVELKNINSFRFVRKALDYEVERQQAVVKGGGSVVQETRLWNVDQGKTMAMRGKEEAMDYRYFPDPDLPPLVVPERMIEQEREALPELPAEKRRRWQSELNLTAYDAAVLTQHPAVADHFERSAEALAKIGGSKLDRAAAGKKMANFIQAELLRHVETDGLGAKIPVGAELLAELLALVDGGTISGKMAKEVFGEMLSTGSDAKTIVDKKGLAQVTDSAALEAEVAKVLEANPKQVEQYRSGNKKVLGFFVGQIMKATRGAANPQLVNEILLKELAK